VFRKLGLLILLIAGLCVAVLFSRRPSNERTWTVDHAVLASSEFAGDNVRIRNIRDFRYPAEGEPDIRYYDRDYDLNTLDSLWLVLTPFRTDRRGQAHLFLSFGFSGGDFVAISVEARKEAEERYSSWRGLLRNYELIYVIADERDLIQRRANKAGKDVYLYPIRAEPDRLRRLFVEMLERANSLEMQPEFYNTLTASCSVTVLRHANSVARRKIPGGLRVLLPGYADGLALEMGLLDTSMSLEEARHRYMISDRSREYADAPDYSMRIRDLDDTMRIQGPKQSPGPVSGL